MLLKEQAKWYVLASGALFLLVSTYLRVKFVFESGNLAGALLLVSMILAVLTFVFGLLSLPRWQSWVAFAISGYALYWLFFTRLYALS
jgi:hypothetical protein